MGLNPGGLVGSRDGVIAVDPSKYFNARRAQPKVDHSSHVHGDMVSISRNLTVHFHIIITSELSAPT
jgi:hypothetical protein